MPKKKAKHRNHQGNPEGDASDPGGADPEKRRRILQEALTEFARHGYSQAKVSEIAARAGVAKGTIYLYFASKDRLFAAAVEMISFPLAAEVRRWFEDPAQAFDHDRLHMIIDRSTTAAQLQPDATLIHSKTLYGTDERAVVRSTVAALLSEWVGIYRDVFAREQERHSLRAADPEILAVLLVSFMHIYVRLPSLLGYADQVGTATWNDALCDLLWYGLAPRI